MSKDDTKKIEVKNQNTGLLVPRQEFVFELTDGSHRVLPENDPDLVALAHNLGVDASFPHHTLLREFIVHHHLNINWYQGRITSEQRKQRLFFLITVALLVLIPWVTFKISSTSSNGTMIAAQMTAVLTGILGFQNAMRSYLERRGYVTIFHRAASKLKKAVFDFEQRWGGCVPLPGTVNEQLFLNNLRDAIRRARDVEDEEEDEFFAAQAALPSIDLRSVLLDAGQSAATIVARGSVAGRAGDQAVAARGAVEALRTRLRDLKASRLDATEATQQQILDEAIVEAQRRVREGEQTLMQLTMRSMDDVK